jgi:hypothetical protein
MGRLGVGAGAEVGRGSERGITHFCKFQWVGMVELHTMLTPTVEGYYFIGCAHLFAAPSSMDRPY